MWNGKYRSIENAKKEETVIEKMKMYPDERHTQTH